MPQVASPCPRETVSPLHHDAKIFCFFGAVLYWRQTQKPRRVAGIVLTLCVLQTRQTEPDLMAEFDPQQKFVALQSR
jgi:hypothetical protein